MRYEVSELLLVEVYAGSARLSKAFRDLDFRTLPVNIDKSRSRGIYVAQFDLNTDHGMKHLTEFLDQEKDNMFTVLFSLMF